MPSYTIEDPSKSTLLFYDNPIDWYRKEAGNSLLEVLNPYQTLTGAFGENFVEIIRNVGFEPFNLQRLGSIDQALEKFSGTDGFLRVIKKLRSITKKIEETKKGTKEFKEYFDQLLTYFSELLVAKTLMDLNLGKIRFQPERAGRGSRSCDNIFTFNWGELYTEITTINTKEEKTLQSKIVDIFEEKAQEQLPEDRECLLILDITTTGDQYSDLEAKHFHIEFPLFDILINCIKKQLALKENKHLIGVLIVINFIGIKDNVPSRGIELLAIENKNNPKRELINKMIQSNQARKV